MSDSTRDSALTSAAQVEALRQEVQHALRHRDSEEILTLLSENSGWTLDHMMQFPHEIASVELFLLNVTRIPELRLFPNLTVVRLAHVGLESMVDLKPLTQVEELWLSDNDITKIEGIDAMTKLRRLYLQGNLLTSMEGLPVLRHLRELWLCRNHITTITGLENVRKLRSFWIASNPIESVEDAFGSFLTHLHDINLAGCQIASFHEIAHLTFLPCLRNVWFADPLFGENPICRLNNYTNFTLHMLSALDTLDYGIISKEQREVAESIYSKKRIYYSMRMQTLERNYWMLCRKVEEIMRAKQASAREAMWTLKDSLIPIQSALAERRVYGGQSSTIAPSDDLNTAKLEEIQRELSRAVGTREVEIQRINKKLLESLEATYTMKQRLKERLCLELHTGGNIRLEESSPKDSWYESARDLLVARFKSEPFEAQFGITGVEVSRVFRVINRGLRLRFDERVKELDIDLTIPSTRKGLVCLFSTIPSTPEDQDLLLQHALVHGMDAPANRNAEGWPFKHIIPPTSDGVPLTNSLYYADEERLSGHLKAGELSGVNLSPNAFSARLVVSRVFLGKSVMALGGSSGAKDENVLRSGKRVSRKDYSRDVFSVYRASSQDNGVRVWYCFDRALILPEFVVDFSYTLKLPFSTPPSLTLFNSTDVLKRVMEELLPNIPRSDLADLRVFCHHFVAFVQLCGSSAFDQFARDETKEAAAKGYALLTAAGINTESKASSPASAAPAKPLTEEVLKVYVQSLGCPSQLTHCYLIRQGLTAVRQDFSSRQLGVLTTLDLSFNALTEFSWFAVAMAAPQLQQLFLRGNQLTTFDTMTSSLASLTTLDLSRNQLSSVHQFDAILGSFPKLKHLDTTDNPMMEEKHAELILLGYLFASSSDITTVNMLDFSTNITANRASVAKWLRDRTLKLNSDCVSTGTTNTNSSNNSSSGARGGSSSPNTEQAGQPIALRYLVRYAHKEWSQNGTYDLMSMESTILPERFFEAALRSVQGLEHRAKLRVMTSTAPSVGTASASGEPAAATPSSASTFYYSRSLIHSLQWVSFLPNIQHLVLRSHNLRDITPVAQLTNLELLDVQDNCIQSLPDLSSLPRLAMLDVSVNLLHSISQLGNLSALRCLNVSGNHLTSLDTGLLMQFSKLEELFLAHNRLHQLKEFYGLKDLTNLLTLDVFGNPFVSGTAESQREARQYLVYHFRRLKVLDSTPISQLESQKAREVFAGKMSGDLLTDRAGPPEHWASLKQLDLTRCSLKEVSLLEGFSGLEILKLGYNLLLRLDGIAHLRHLKALNLSHNKLGSAGNRAIGEALKEIHCLESLSLESNHITDVSSLGLQLPRLKFLNLKGNDVQLIDRGMGVVPELREVILDHNKLRAFGADCFAGCPFITDLSADENVIRLTEGLARLHHLENLSLGSNRLGDLNNLINDLRGCPLTKATFVGNPVARKTPYRPTIISTFTQLTSLDGRSITREERDKAETVRTMEYAVPANVVIDLNYMSGLPGGVSGSGSPNLGPASSAPSISGGKGGVVIQRVGGGGGGGAGIPSVRLQPMASNNSGNGRGGFSRGPNQVRATTRM